LSSDGQLRLGLRGPSLTPLRLLIAQDETDSDSCSRLPIGPGMPVGVV
jgi:hypothetical protein